MDTLVIAITASGLSLLLIFLWMVSISIRKKRLAEERKEKDEAYRRTIERARQQEKADRAFKADTGHVPTILFLAKEAERTNLGEAMSWYEKAAKLESRAGMLGIVRLCQLRRDDMVLKSKSKFWEQSIAAVDGDQSAKFEVGKAYIRGLGIEQDISRGLKAVEEVANQGKLEAILYLGEWNISKNNPNKSGRKAGEWFYKATKKGSAEAMIQLAQLYMSGVGIKQSTLRGRYWLERAGEKGSEKAMFLAGEAWLMEGDEDCRCIAYIWLFLAGNFGSEEAKALRDQVAAGLGVDTVVGLQSMCKPIAQKLKQKQVVKHSIIKALNKLYKRQTYFPEKHGSEYAPAKGTQSTPSGSLDPAVNSDSEVAEQSTESSAASADYRQTSV